MMYCIQCIYMYVYELQHTMSASFDLWKELYDILNIHVSLVVKGGQVVHL